jgi:hypothetical protein
MRGKFVSTFPVRFQFVSTFPVRFQFVSILGKRKKILPLKSTFLAHPAGNDGNEFRFFVSISFPFVFQT